MFKFISAMLISFYSFSAFAGGIVCSTKNIIGFPDQFVIGYEPGPAGLFTEISFARCENPEPGKKCSYKEDKTFNMNPVQKVQNWPIGIYSAQSTDGSSVRIKITKQDGIDAEYEGSVVMILNDGGTPWEYDLGCDTLE